ncbi:hypothetical protein EHO60_04170 [Leptospira fletcheri]|uniref:Chromosome partitioning protein ParB n=1 Tax=Leptospira fletcheri TaxID=2484981 RepID=A0A4R9GG41_9LEPT|nr:hypothetical protein [Leptospira fletcheri]TGK11509.1 hypothetical protein EHO60_04170 [Leptospira fletcheri]
MKTVSIRTLRFLGLALSLFLITAWGSLSAESKCHGLSKGQCEADSDCTWVSGYQKKDGKNVEAYCRAKPGKGEDSAEHHKKKEDGDTVKKSDSKKDHDEEVESKKGKKSKKEKEEDDDDEDSKKSKKDKKSKKEKESDKEDKKSKKSKHKKED